MARVRHVPGTVDKLLASKWVLTQPQPTFDWWQNEFNNGNPLCLEVGCGRGRFLYEAGSLLPHYNYIGLDVVPEIISDALDTYTKRKSWPQNIRFIAMDAALLTQVLPKQSIDRLFLHFSDPWPKVRHAKRRLTHPTLLSVYKNLLTDNGYLLFKSDHQDFYQWTLEILSENNWEILSHTSDLYQDLPSDNIPTEYERRYAKRGKTIGRIVAKPKN